MRNYGASIGEGAEVQRVELFGGSAQIALNDGRRGWVPAEQLGVVDPRLPAPR